MSLLKFVRKYYVTIDNRKYPIVQIGRQWWMAENLDWKFTGLTISDQNSTNPTGCYFDNDESTYGIAGNKYGLLYNWYAARYIMDNSLVADWRVPNNADFTNFKNAVPDVDCVKSTFGWNDDFNGTNELQFNGVSTGYRSSLANYHFYGLGNVAPYWGVESETSAYSMNLERTSIIINHLTTSEYKLDSYCIRLCSDATVNIGGREYPTTRIGNQVWLAENLDLTWDGLVIGAVDVPTSPAAWYFNNDEATYGASGRQCGLLYNWYAVEYINAHRKELLPYGWHVATVDELDSLISYVGGIDVAGTKLKSSNVSWSSNWGGMDNYGFNLKPTGFRNLSPIFRTDDAYTALWTSTEVDADNAFFRYFNTDASAGEYSNTKSYGLSLRLVKDAS